MVCSWLVLQQVERIHIELERHLYCHLNLSINSSLFVIFFNFPNYVRKHKLLYGGFSRTDNFFYFRACPPFVIRLCCLMQVTNCYPTADPLTITRRHIFINMQTSLHQKADLWGSVDCQSALSLLFMKVIQLLSTL